MYIYIYIIYILICMYIYNIYIYIRTYIYKQYQQYHENNVLSILKTLHCKIIHVTTL